MYSPANKRLLVVESDDITLGLVHESLSELGYPVTPCTNEADALALATVRDFDLAAIGLGGLSGQAVGLARELQKRRPGLPVIVLAPVESIPAALAALHEGVEDYALLPPDREELRLRIGRILDARELDSRVALLNEEIVRRARAREFVSHSPAMRALLDKARKIAPMKSTVLVLGESGVGKELIARFVHFSSNRKDQPFVALNCSAIPYHLIESELFGHERGAFTGAVARVRGKFELADRGTLFLDEVGEMNPAAQVKLLRVLEEHEFMRVGGTQSIRVDVRLLAATNANLERLVEEGRFRSDLYFRLKVVTLSVPPLRDRREDIEPLARLFTDQICRANNLPPRQVTAEVLAALRSYHWPGNVREMQNLLENLLVSTSGEALRLEDLPAALRGASRYPVVPFDPAAGMTVEAAERELIRKTLEQNRGNRTRTARMLGIGVRTLQRKIARYGFR